MKFSLSITLIVMSAFLWAGCGNNNSSSTPAQTNTTSSPIVQPEVYAQKKMDVAALTQAVQQYNATEGHYPQSLQDLAPNYIAKVPQAPAGYKLNYDSTSGSVTLTQQ